MASDRPERLSGAVTRRAVRRGTASEHSAVVLHTDDGEDLILQRISGNPFADRENDKLVGRRVTVEGYRLDNVFRYESAEPE